MLPSGDQMVKCLTQSYDANRNFMGRAHANLSLNTMMYQVEFALGKVTELTTHAIAESMYAQCGANGNEYLLLDLLFDYHNNDKETSLTDQQISVWRRTITCKSTSGWKICCQHKVSSTSLDKLFNLKEIIGTWIMRS